MPRCLQCGRVLSNCIINLSPSIMTVLGDCTRCGHSVTASRDSWTPEDFHLDLDGNIWGQLELPWEH